MYQIVKLIKRIQRIRLRIRCIRILQNAERKVYTEHRYIFFLHLCIQKGDFSFFFAVV